MFSLWKVKTSFGFLYSVILIQAIMVVKFESISDRELLNIFKTMEVPINFIGIKQEFRKQKAFQGFYIVNLEDDIKGQGTHWTCFFLVNQFCIYFDSFGLPPPTDIVQFCKGFAIMYNVNQVQHIMSDACGYYVIDFINYFHNITKVELVSKMNISYHLNKFIQPFDVNKRTNNENVLKRRIRELLNR
jgi:hypothetical protein